MHKPLNLGGQVIPVIPRSSPFEYAEDAFKAGADMCDKAHEYGHAGVTAWEFEPGRVALVIGANPAHAWAHRFDAASLKELAQDLLDLSEQMRDRRAANEAVA